MANESVVDLAFPITPGRVPLDHGYALYSALVGPVPLLHEAPWLGIHPLSGRKVGESALVLTRGSHVTLRLPAEQIPVALSLANRNVRIGDEIFQLGSPTLRALEGSGSLFAWQVAIRLTKAPKLDDGSLDMAAFQSAFEAEAERQLAKLEIKARISTVAKRNVTIKDQRIIAFSVQVDDLSVADSIKLQAHGLGGKRRMGCGVFRSARPVETEG